MLRFLSLPIQVDHHLAGRCFDDQHLDVQDRVALRGDKIWFQPGDTVQFSGVALGITCSSPLLSVISVIIVILVSPFCR